MTTTGIDVAKLERFVVSSQEIWAGRRRAAETPFNIVLEARP